MKSVDFEFGKFEFYPEMIIGRLKEGIHYDMKKNQLLFEAVINHYGLEMPISYISIRENSYSIDPMVHRHNKQYDSLCGIAIVQDEKSELCSIALESKFFKEGKLVQFNEIEEALVWANKKVQEQLTKNSYFLSHN